MINAKKTKINVFPLLKSYQRRFALFNENYWADAGESKNTNSRLLVEGLLGGMPTHLFRLGCSAKAIEIHDNLRPVILSSSRSDSNNRLFESFGMHDFVYLDEIPLEAKDYIDIYFRIKKFILNCNVSTLLSMEYKGVNIGKLIYDDIIRRDDRCYTVSKVKLNHLKKVYKALKLLKIYENIIDKFNIEKILVSHNEYIDFGMLSVICLIKKKSIIIVNDIEVSKHNKVKNIYLHERFSDYIEKIINSNNKCNLVEEGKVHIRERMDNKNGLIFDTGNAYKNKLLYKREDFEKISHNKKKNVFIFMHVYSDAPHTSQMYLYRDYYEWFKDTVNIIKNINNVNWYIKKHPSAYLYGENIGINGFELDKLGNVFLVPDNFSTASVEDVADVIVTCQGTIGLEASCLGIPVIVVGEPFYKKFDFCISPDNKEEYYTLLNNCDKIEKLSDMVKERALMTMGAFRRFRYIDKTILDDDVYKYGGYDKNVDYEKAFIKIEKNMSDKKYYDLELYKKVIDVMNEPNNF